MMSRHAGSDGLWRDVKTCGDIVWTITVRGVAKHRAFQSVQHIQWIALHEARRVLN